MLSLLVVLLSMVATASAYDMKLDPHIYKSSFLRELAERGEIHIDPSEPPLRPESCIQKRQVDDSAVPTTVAETTTPSSSESSSPSATETTSATTTETETLASETATPNSSTPVSTSITPTITVITTPLPSPFDTSLGSNFTNPACPQFFQTFLSNSTLQSCVPISLLLQNSNSFFRAQRSPIILAETLDSACNAPLAICSPLLANIASQLIDDANCGQDYRQQNPLVTQAYAGLIAYEPIYRATCLKNSETGSYCFSEAITNSSNPSDFYPYYTALGMNMPTAAHPTCSQCLEEVMRIFAGYAESEIQPLAKTYLTCANQVVAGCGNDFAATDVNVGSVSSPDSAASLPRISLLAAGLTSVVAIWIGLC